MRRATFRNAALISGALFLAAAAPVLADSADRFPQNVPQDVPELPELTPAAVPAIDLAFDALQRDAATADLKIDWTALRAYYATNGGAAIWTTANGYTLLGQAWIVQIPRAIKAGMVLPEATLLRIAGMTPPTDAASQTRNEALMSAIFVGTAIDAIGPLGGAKLRSTGVLDKVTKAKDAGVVIAQEWPSYYRFWSLYQKLPTYAAYYQAGGWQKVPKVDKIEPGQTHSAIPAVRARMLYTGELLASTQTDEVYDADLQSAVQLFQRKHGLNPDGVIGGRTLEEMNVSAERRLQMVLLNLDRMREQGSKFEPRHLVVNIPSQEVKVIDDGKVVFITNAIVGKIDRKTPTLDSVIKVAKFNPEWNAPHKIASNDEVRRMRADPGFLRDHGFTMYDLGGMEVDPSSVDWHSVGPGNFPYRLVQRPGPENALGPLKLDFPNDHAVYLHGTNQKGLFAKQDRYFSSGCMRMQQPIDMAAFLLADDPAWPREKIDQVVEGGKTTYVPLRTPMPVHVVYMTAWTDEDGVMQFRKDMYRYDDYTDIPNELQPAANLIAESQPAVLKPIKTESK
jgi:L,D-transpeptidase YcbB